MRIAHFPSSFLPFIGGAEILTHNLALHQHQAGHQVTVITKWSSWRAVASAFPYRVVPLFPKSVVAVLETRRYGYDMRWLVGKQLAFYQKIFDFDIWHVHGAYPTGFVAIPTLKRMRIPSLVRPHGVDIQKLPEIGYGVRLDPVTEQDVVRTLSAFDRVIAISASVRSELLSLGVSPERIRDVPNGVDVSRIRALQVDRSQVRVELGWPMDKIVLLTVGRNHPVKGYKLIPGIIKQVAAVRQDFFWVIVGRDAGPIAEMAEALGVDEYLRVVPQIGHGGANAGRLVLSLPTEELIKVYKAADVFAFPSMLEAFGIVLVEAMAVGLPIVTTDAPGCRDVVEHGVTGLISPVGDTSRMAQNILKLLADPALRARLGQNGEVRSAEYEWSKVASQYRDVYEELVSRLRGAMNATK